MNHWSERDAGFVVLATRNPGRDVSKAWVFELYSCSGTWYEARSSPFLELDFTSAAFARLNSWNPNRTARRVHCDRARRSLPKGPGVVRIVEGGVTYLVRSLARERKRFALRLRPPPHR